MATESLRQRWRTAITDSGLSPRARHIGLTLSLHMNADGGSCYPGLDLLAKETGCHRATVVRGIDELVDNGFLRRWRRGGRRMDDGGVPNQYQALLPDPERPSQEENGQETVAGGERSGGVTVASRGLTVANRGSDRRRRRTREGQEVDIEDVETRDRIDIEIRRLAAEFGWIDDEGRVGMLLRFARSKVGKHITRPQHMFRDENAPKLLAAMRKEGADWHPKLTSST